jgi:uncharacterized protein
MKSLSVYFIKFYQFVTKPFPQCCRFYPTCSQYAIESIEKFGVFKGSFFTIKRIFKCGPWHPGGYDPIP